MFDMIDKTVAVSRLANDSANADKQTYAKVANVKIFLNPMSLEQIAMTGGEYAKDFVAWADVDANIQQGDKITLDTKDYVVGGVRTWDYGGAPHKDLLLALPSDE